MLKTLSHLFDDGKGDEFVDLEIIDRLNDMARQLNPLTVRPNRLVLVPSQMRAINKIPTSWNACFEVAQAYYITHGHCNATRNVTWPEDDPDGFRLGVWVAKQRVLHRKSRLLLEQAQKLESIGIAWEPQAVLWDAGFVHVKSFFDAYGHCNVLFRMIWPEDDPDGFRLGVWVANQRKKYRNGKLSAEQVKRLESIGMVW